MVFFGLFCFFKKHFAFSFFVWFAHEHAQAVARAAHWSMQGVFSSILSSLVWCFLFFVFEAGSFTDLEGPRDPVISTFPKTGIPGRRYHAQI